MKKIYSYERCGLDSSYIYEHCNFSSRNGLRAQHILGKRKQLTFSDGFVLYEILPQTRNLFSTGIETPIKVDLPYMYFGVRYFKSDNKNGFYSDGSYIYPGIFHAGLQLCCSVDPVQSFDDNVFAMRSDPAGYICIRHELDYSEYKSIEELSSVIISSWYNYFHHNNWRNYKHPSIARGNRQYKLKNFLMSSKAAHEDKINCVVIPDYAKIEKQK